MLLFDSKFRKLRVTQTTLTGKEKYSEIAGKFRVIYLNNVRILVNYSKDTKKSQNRKY